MSWEIVAKSADIPEGSARRVTLHGRTVAVVRSGGQLYAVEDTCSHARASLSEGFVDGLVLECPLHGAQFDLRSGRALTLPATRPLETYEVTEHDGVVLIRSADRRAAGGEA